VREIMALADRANQYIDEHKPWVIAKIEGQEAALQAVCSQGLNLFRVLMGYLAPVLPLMANKVESFLAAPLDWAPAPLLDQEIQPFQPLMTRVEAPQIEAMLASSRAELAAQTVAPAHDTSIAAIVSAPAVVSTAPVVALKAQVDYETFSQVDLRIARILQAESVEGADKLLKLTLDVGEAVPRTVFAGIKAAYPNPMLLEQKLTVMVANLAPRKMRFGLSEGMVLAAGPGGSEIFLLSPDSGAQPGMPVK